MGKKKRDTLQLDKNPTWVTKGDIKNFEKYEFQRIVRFFVITPPDKKISAKGKELSEYGVTDEDKMLEELLSGIRYMTRVQTIEIDDLRDAGLNEFPPSVMEERVCFAISGRKPVTSLFIKIRDSLAHGRFNFGGSEKMQYLIMEDINSKGNCSARMVLKMATLKKWIDKLEHS